MDSVTPSPPLQELMLAFESIGENCELGLAQRLVGIEPLGLLRFASSPPDVIMKLLADRCEGLGDPETIQLVLERDGEYYVKDHRYGLWYHTHQFFGQIDPITLHERECAKIAYLARNFLEKLEEGEKILVRHMNMDAEQIARLYDLLQGYGPSPVLWVVVADSEHAAGTIEQLDRRLFKGYIKRFAPPSNVPDLDLDAWIELLQPAREMISVACC